MDELSLIELMSQHGVKPTANRIIVAKALAAEDHPLSMTELEDRIGSIDKSGIFRALLLFKQQHLVHVLEGSQGTLYELCHSSSRLDDNDMHVHFHCDYCGETYCLENIPIPNIDLPLGYRMQQANYMIKGACPKCVNKSN